ncbi:hypothetical protein J4417_01780 [Candidatus Woesearchaeota archaeon]|nr:hypothetical protein [Candidatus Woesearchaeota archaeon]
MLIFLTGKPGVGKTSMLAELASQLQAEKGKDKKPKRKVAGFLMEEIREGEVRKGFFMKDLASGEKELLAHLDSRFVNSGYHLSRFHVSMGAIDKSLARFEKSFPLAEYVFIDEIGRFGLFSETFSQALDTVLHTPNKIIVATLHVSYLPLFGHLGEVLFLKQDNHQEIKEKLATMIGVSSPKPL